MTPYQRRKPWPMAAQLQTQVERRERDKLEEIASRRKMTIAALVRFAVRYLIENEGHKLITNTKRRTKPM